MVSQHSPIKIIAKVEYKVSSLTAFYVIYFITKENNFNKRSKIIENLLLGLKKTGQNFKMDLVSLKKKAIIKLLLIKPFQFIFNQGGHRNEAVSGLIRPGNH